MQPTTLGIDLGGSGLRVATDCRGEAELVRGDWSRSGFSRVISPPDERNGGWHVSSLKRLLDSGRLIRAAEDGLSERRADQYLTAVFRDLCKDESICQQNVSPHVLGAVPPIYTQRQRSAFRNVLTAAGYTRAKLVDDSLAALLACRDQLHGQDSVLVYSWGASTFYAALYRSVGTSFRAVIAPEGDHELGGDEINAALLEYIAARGGKVDFTTNPAAVFHETERVKLALAMEEEARFSLAAMTEGKVDTTAGNGAIPIPQEVFIGIVSPLLNKTLELVREVLENAQCPTPDAVLLVGGTTRIPLIRRELDRIFAGKLRQASLEAVALGAVIHGRMLPAAEWEAAENRRNGPPGVMPVNDESRPSGSVREDRQDVPSASRGKWAATLNLESLLTRAEKLEGAGRLDEAVQELESVHARLGKFSCLLFYRAATEQLDADRLDLAFPLLRKASQLDPAHRQVARTYAQLCIRQSDDHLKQRNFNEAWGLACEAVSAIERLPHAERDYAADLALCLHRQARLLCRLDRIEAAENLLKRCLQLDPGHAVYGEELERVRGSRPVPPAPQRRPPGDADNKIGRNDPCPCGSGKKYKKCHGR